MTEPALSSTDLTNPPGAIVLAGAGKMGGAMLRGWLAAGLPRAHLVVIDPHPSAEIEALASQGVRINPRPDAISGVAALVVAVKPQTFTEAATHLRGFAGSDTVIVSIMAGQTLARIGEAFGGAVVRAMPNTPAAIGRGITVAVAGPTVSVRQKSLAHVLLAATGAVEWIADEMLMDAVTAVSGSGPAYVFLLAEELAQAGIAAGLPRDLALRLARETVAGAGELLHRSTESAETLRKNVTSPGGTTAAALDVLMSEAGLRELMTRAVAAAAQRSRELSGS